MPTPSPDSNEKILVVRSANEWMQIARELPEERKLYDEIWLEGETSWLFGMPGSGKSLFAVQIGVEIAKTEPVLYCDFELSLRQFRKRYRIKDSNEFQFPDSFFRAEFAKDIEFESSGLIDSIHIHANTINSKVIIIDNLSWVIENSEKGDIAGNFMKKLSALKRNYNYSFLIIAHTPKRDVSRPITMMDMAGSMRLQNFIDSSCAIVESAKTEGLRYLKQTKSRNEEKVYGMESVMLLSIEQGNDAFTKFTKFGIASEIEHLSSPTEDERISKRDECLELIKVGKTYREIHEITGLSTGVISKYFKQSQEKNQNNDKAPFP
jgi:predicted ATP-dependent serine protease